MIRNRNQLNSLDHFTIRHPVTDVTVYCSRRNGKTLIRSIDLGRTGGDTPESRPDPRIAGRITAFLDGRRIDLASLPIDLSGLSPFAGKVLLAASAIPFGETISYSELARRAGNPRAARAAASAMRNNPLPLIIPCHRVIRSDGSIGGFMGKTSGREIELKKKLIRREAEERQKEGRRKSDFSQNKGKPKAG